MLNIFDLRNKMFKFRNSLSNQNDTSTLNSFYSSMDFRKDRLNFMNIYKVSRLLFSYFIFILNF